MIKAHSPLTLGRDPTFFHFLYCWPFLDDLTLFFMILNKICSKTESDIINQMPHKHLILKFCYMRNPFLWCSTVIVSYVSSLEVSLVTAFYQLFKNKAWSIQRWQLSPFSLSLCLFVWPTKSKNYAFPSDAGFYTACYHRCRMCMKNSPVWFAAFVSLSCIHKNGLFIARWCLSLLSWSVYSSCEIGHTAELLLLRADSAEVVLAIEIYSRVERANSAEDLVSYFHCNRVKDLESR